MLWRRWGHLEVCAVIKREWNESLDAGTQRCVWRYAWRTLFSVLHCVALCRIVLQCVAVCCSALHCVAVCCIGMNDVPYAVWCSLLHCVALCRCVLQCVAVRCSALQCVALVWLTYPMQCDAVCCSVLHCVAFCWSVLQCVAVCCSGTNDVPCEISHFSRRVACNVCAVLRYCEYWGESEACAVI